MLTDYSLEKVLFESISAFATVGMSTGITYNLPPAAEWVLMALMFTRPHRHRDGRVRARPVLPAPALPAAGGTPHHRLSEGRHARQSAW